MSKIAFVIPGAPQGKQRPKWCKGGTYTPKDTVDYETYIKELFVTQYPDFILMTGPLKIDLLIWKQIPKSTSQKKAKLMLEGHIIPEKKPDMDNVLKVIMDALETLAYRNDNQFADAIIRTRYSNQPLVRVEIEELSCTEKKS